MVIVSATKFYQLYIESTVDNPLSLTDNGIYANGQRFNDCEVYIDGVGRYRIVDRQSIQSSVR